MAGTEILDPVTLQRGYFVARYTTDGALDPTFGRGGVGLETEDDPGAITANAAIALQVNGKIVVFGRMNRPLPTGGHTFDVATARFDGDATLHAATVAPSPVAQTPIPAALSPLVDEAFARWHAAGVHTSSLPRKHS